MNKIILIVGLSTLLGACTSGDSKGTKGGNNNSNQDSEILQNGQVSTKVMKPINGRRAFLVYDEASRDNSFDGATLSKDGNSINLFGKDINITKMSEVDDIKVFMGNPEKTNDYFHNLNKNFQYASFGSIWQQKTDKGGFFVAGKVTDNMPQKGTFEYLQTNIDNNGSSSKDIYVVDFDNKKVSAELNKYFKFQATIIGNTFQSVDLFQYNATDDEGNEYQYKTSMNGAFFGPNAEELAGSQSRQVKKAGEEWAIGGVRVFGAKKQ